MKKTAALWALLVLLAACAKQPGDIVATSVPVDPYMQMSCRSLATERDGKETRLGTLSGEQEETANRDAAWMAMVHIPVASMASGDHADEIANLKGQIAAIDRAAQAKSCRLGAERQVAQ
jgi:hypothetical protein